MTEMFFRISFTCEIASMAYVQVGQYPRRTFADGERDCSLHGAGLNGKQEALFLELM